MLNTKPNTQQEFPPRCSGFPKNAILPYKVLQFLNMTAPSSLEAQRQSGRRVTVPSVIVPELCIASNRPRNSPEPDYLWIMNGCIAPPPCQIL